MRLRHELFHLTPSARAPRHQLIWCARGWLPFVLPGFANAASRGSRRANCSRQHDQEHCLIKSMACGPCLRLGHGDLCARWGPSLALSATPIGQHGAKALRPDRLPQQRHGSPQLAPQVVVHSKACGCATHGRMGTSRGGLSSAAAPAGCCHGDGEREQHTAFAAMRARGSR